MEFKPHAYQSACIEKIIHMPNVGLFLDMGLGKTVITLTALRSLIYDRFLVRKVLIIAPKKVAESTWTKEREKWDHTQILRISKVLGSREKRIRALTTPADIYVINRENVTWLCDYYRNAWPFDMVVIDESSSFKSHKAKRFKALSAMIPRISRVLELTGTPSPNGIMDLWAQIYLLDEGVRLGKRFSDFRNRFFDAGFPVNGVVYNYEPKSMAYETVTGLISDLCISMKAEDYLELPDLVMDEIPVELDSKAAKAYLDLERQMVLELPEGEDLTVTSAAALSNKLLQLANGALYDEDRGVHAIHDCKLEAFLELVEALAGQPAIVFYAYLHDKERILKALAKTDTKVRELKSPEDEEAWNWGEVDILLAHPASAAYGLNLQDGGNHVIWFGLTWNYEQYTQANARLHRQGQTASKVIIHHLVAQDTRDEDVMEALKNKENAQEYVMARLAARIEEIRKEAKA